MKKLIQTIKTALEILRLLLTDHHEPKPFR